jgi:hypothetical protein
VSIVQCLKVCLDICIIKQKNIISNYDYLLGSCALNAKFTLIFVFVLFILATFAANSSNLGKNILAYVLSSSFVVNANVIANLSLISKASLALRIALQDLLKGCD